MVGQLQQQRALAHKLEPERATEREVLLGCLAEIDHDWPPVPGDASASVRSAGGSALA